MLTNKNGDAKQQSMARDGVYSVKEDLEKEQNASVVHEYLYSNEWFLFLHLADLREQTVMYIIRLVEIVTLIKFNYSLYVEHEYYTISFLSLSHRPTWNKITALKLKSMNIWTQKNDIFYWSQTSKEKNSNDIYYWKLSQILSTMIYHIFGVYIL